MTAPASNITPGTGSWIWTNPFGRFPSASFSITSSTEVDNYRFQADVTGAYTISVSGGTLDSILRVYNSSGVSIAGPIDTQFAGGTESTTLNLTAGNWYYVGVGGFNTSTGTYSLSINGPTPVINDITTPAPAYSGSFSGASISPAGDIDWFKLIAPAGTTSLSFSTSGLGAGLDTVLQLLDASGNSLLGVVNNAGAGLGDLASASITAGATYYVGVTSLGSGSYNFNADFGPDQSLAVLSIAALSADKPEGNNQTTPFTFTVTHSGSTAIASSVNWNIGANQSPAADASDFIGATSGTLNWAAGDGGSKTITIGVNGDTTYEGDLPEHFTVNLSNASGATIGTATASGSIQNDDSPAQPAVLSISALSADKPEGNNQTTAFTFTVTHTGDTSASSSVHWAIGANQSPATDASDFIGATSGTLNWAVGDSSSKTITIGVNGDTTYEGDLPEHFTVNLSNASGATIGTATANGSIQNDDPNPAIITGTIVQTTSSGLTFSFAVSIERTDGGAINPNQTTWLVVHGWNSSPANFSDLISAIHSQRPSDQILTLDWHTAADTPDPLDAESRIPLVASWAAGALSTAGFTGSNLNEIGHSFGSYVAGETAELIAGGVNTIIGLDPAANVIGGYDSDGPSGVHFAQYSKYSWAFHDSDPFNPATGDGLGNPNTPVTADEAFDVANSSHTEIPTLFTYFLNHSNDPVGQYFQLSRLLNEAALGNDPTAPWTPDQYDDSGVLSASGKYEAVITAASGGVVSQSITYIPILAPEIAVSGSGTNIVDGDATPSGTDLTDFGSVTQGGAAVQHTFTVSNTGTGTLTTSALTVPSGFSVLEGLSASIPAGGSDTFTVQLDTTSVGTKSGGQISFTTNDGDENPFNFSITGTVNATSTPEISVSGNSTNIVDGDTTPSSTDLTDFGGVTQGGSAVQHTFTVSNTGTGTLTTSGLQLPTGYSLVEGLSSSIQAGSFDTFTIRLDTSSTGTKSGQISFTTNDGDENPFNFQITGAVNATPVPEIAVSGNGANIPDGDLSSTSSDGTDFGTVAQGVTVDRVFTVNNIGASTLTTSGLLLPAGYTLVEGLSPSIPAGNSDTFTVRLDTSSVGTKSGQISFTTNDSDENPFNFSVTGTVSETPLSQPDLTVSNLAIAQAVAQPRQTITIDYDLNNVGSVGATGFELGFYISTDPTVDKNDELFAYSPNASQLANSSTHHHGTAPLPDDLTPGVTYYIGIIADDTNVIPNELNEDNNGSNVVSVAVNSITDPQAGLVSINDVTIAEGNGGTKIETFTVTRSGGTAAFDVNFTTADGTATTADHDYVANSGTLHFAAGVNTQTISVTINGDTKLESSETFLVNLSGATNGTTISDNSALGTIADDDGTRSPHEFNGDGKNDFLWRNDDGSIATWDMNDRSSSGAVIATVSNDWHIADTGDFNGDGKSDILWRNDSGAVATWNMNDRSYDGLVIGTVTNDWHIAGTGDFNGDHKTDILWRNDSGQAATWDMNDRSSSGAVIATVTNDWHIAGTGDFNGDGKTDILWRNDNGSVATWDMNDRSSSGAVIANVSNDWHIAGTGDFNGDGKTDILWRNDNGAVATWDMNDRSSSGAVIATVTNDWHIAGTGDFNGDHKTDILWRNDNGSVATWDMNDHSYSGAVIATAPNDWHIV
jgi:hypothetical protein